MSTRSVSEVLNQGATNQARENLHFVFYAYEDITLKSVSARMRATATDGGGNAIPSSVTVYVNVDGVTVLTREVAVSSLEAEYKTAVLDDVIVKAGHYADIHFKLTRDYTTVYYNNLTAYFCWGSTGAGDRFIPDPQASQIECPDLILNIEYSSPWRFDGGNDGYGHLCGEDGERFKFFKKNRAGYPTNQGVWKLDGQNDGYPWKTGYIPIGRRGDRVKIMENGAWTEADGVILFEDGAAVTGYMKIKRSV